MEKESWWQKFSRWIIKYIVRWDLVEEMPPSKKHVLVGAHHTSNWDWVIGIFMMMALGLRPHWVGKDSLFRGVMGPIMRWTGGISVVRGARKNFVGQIVDFYNESDELFIALAPEGTRKYVDHWKTGFYYIAKGANVPVTMAFLDYKNKSCGIGGYFTPNDLEEDLKILQKFYAGVTGKFPKNQGLVRFKNQSLPPK